jgi:hypothetical protein
MQTAHTNRSVRDTLSSVLTSSAVAAPHPAFRAVCLQAPAGAPPDTWVQLLEQCTADPEAQPAVTSYMLRQLQQQQQQMAAGRADAAAAVRAEAATRCRQQDEMQAVARAEVAELRGQVQVLQGQLQQLLTALKGNQQQV